MMPIFSSLQEMTWNSLFNIRNGVKLEGENLNMKILKIPVYQRAYVWNEHKVSSLLSSIMTSLITNKSYYFLGNIVLCKEEENSYYGNFFIVDGQQRITTLTIIMSTIRFIARKKNYNEVESKCDQFIQMHDRERRDTRLDETRFRLCLPVSTKKNVILLT
jgi:uncharacterized protein with ParB-like and HNH nuclease domain